MPSKIILSLNSGSSSLKFGLFRIEDSEPTVLYTGEVEGIGAKESEFWIRSASGGAIHQDSRTVSGQEDALRTVATNLSRLNFPAPDAIGHRVVHGGPKLVAHCEITPDVFTELEAAARFAPLHVPVALHLIRLAERQFPGLPEFACFDTAFHATMPEQARRFALPEEYWAAGVRRYGFHGLSCESALRAVGKPVPARMIVAHLGSGASITAISNGASIDTTMGLTPTGGIVMSTRTGDLDPGVLLYVLREKGWDADRLERLLNTESGLLALSGLSGDMRELQQASDAENARARLAIGIFCRTAQKSIGGFVAVLGGLDLLVFTGGIGEHDANVREQICAGLDSLGIVLDAKANRRHAREIQAASSRVKVNVIASDEDTQIALHTYNLLTGHAS